MHEQAQLRLKKDEVTKLGAAVYVVLPQDLLRTRVFKEENRLLSTVKGPFAELKSLVFSTVLSDPAGHASAIYGVSRKCARWGQWVENDPCWFVIDRKGKVRLMKVGSGSANADAIGAMIEKLIEEGA